jgi:hypothetical protein
VAIEQATGLGLELDEQRSVGLEGVSMVECLSRLEAAFRVGHLVSMRSVREVNWSVPAARPSTPGTDALLHTTAGR